MFYFKKADYSIYIPAAGSSPLENLPPCMRRRKHTDEQNCCCQAGEIKCKGIGKRNQFPLSLSSCTLCFYLSCLYRQIIVLSFLLWTVPLKHLWNGGCVRLVKGCDPDDKSVHLPEEVPAVLLLYRSAPEHMGSGSTLYYLEDSLLPLEFSWGQCRLSKWLTYPWDHNPFCDTCRRSMNFTVLNRLLRKGCPVLLWPGATVTPASLWGLPAERKKTQPKWTSST